MIPVFIRILGFIVLVVRFVHMEVRHKTPQMDEKAEIKLSDITVVLSGDVIHDKIAGYVVEITGWNRQVIEEYTAFVEERLTCTDPMSHEWNHLPESYRHWIKTSSHLTSTFEIMQMLTTYLKETTQTYIAGNLGQAEYVLLIIVVHWNKAYTTLIPHVLSHLELMSTLLYELSDLFDRAGVTQQEKDVICTISTGLMFNAELFEELLNRTNALSMDLNAKFNEVFPKLQEEGWIDIRGVQPYT